MVPENDGLPHFQPKTEMWAGSIICLVSIGLAISVYLDGMLGWASNSLFIAALGAWMFNRGRARKKAAEAESGANAVNDHNVGS